MSEIEKAYWNHEVSKRLEIGESTLRKWCIELEKNGYIFIRGTMDSRAFTDHDLAALTYFKQLTKGKKHTKEQAAIMVVDKFGRKGGNEGTTPVQSMSDNQSIENLESMVKELLEHNKKQEEFNKALLERLNRQEQYIKETLEKRDQYLLESIRKSQEEKAATIEKKKIPWYKKLLGKDE